jgi:excisionase family DNA binding protein
MEEAEQAQTGVAVTLLWPDAVIDRLAEAVTERMRLEPTHDTSSPWLTVEGAAHYLGTMSPDAVRKAAQRGQLPAYQPHGPGTRWFFDRRELDAFLREGRVEAPLEPDSSRRDD